MSSTIERPSLYLVPDLQKVAASEAVPTLVLCPEADALITFSGNGYEKLADGYAFVYDEPPRWNRRLVAEALDTLHVEGVALLVTGQPISQLLRANVNDFEVASVGKVVFHGGLTGSGRHHTRETRFACRRSLAQHGPTVHVLSFEYLAAYSSRPLQPTKLGDFEAINTALADRAIGKIAFPSGFNANRPTGWINWSECRAPYNAVDLVAIDGSRSVNIQRHELHTG